MAFVYALLDPHTKEPRYVGWAKNPKARFRVHLRSCLKPTTPVSYWIRELIEKGHAPILRIEMETTNPRSETDWIFIHKQHGAKLLNVINPTTKKHYKDGP